MLRAVMKHWPVAWDVLLEPAPCLLVQKGSLMVLAPSMSIVLPEPASLHPVAHFIPMVRALLKARLADLDSAPEPVVLRPKILPLIVHQRFATSLSTNALHRLVPLRIKMEAARWEPLVAIQTSVVLKAAPWVNASCRIAPRNFRAVLVRLVWSVPAVNALCRHAVQPIPREAVVPI